MNAGRDLDALVAEKVMGWTPWNWTTGALDAKPGTTYFAVDESGAAAYDHGAIAVYDSTSKEPIQWFAPSRDIADAWQVVERIGADYGAGVEARKQLRNFRPGYTCRIYGGNLEYPTAELQIYVQSDTAPFAICLAALRAVGVKP